MKKLLFLSFLFFIAGCSPEFGVSEEGIEKCINKSMDGGLNTFASKKIYERCLKSIDKKIAQDKKERKKEKLRAERDALKKKKDREKNKEYYAKLKIQEEEKKEQERLRLIDKYKEVVLKTKKEFIDAGWEELTFSDKYWFLVINKKEISDATTALILYYLPRTEEPLFSPGNYFDKRWSYKLQGKSTNFSNNPDRWWIFECDNKRYIHAPKENKLNEIYFTKWISRHPIVYRSQYNVKTEIIDNDALLKKALRFLDDSKAWVEPKKGTLSQKMFNYACPNNKI